MEKADEVVQPLLDAPKEIVVPLPKGHNNGLLISLWILSLLLTSLFTYLATSRSVASSPLGNFAHGYATELRTY